MMNGVTDMTGNKGANARAWLAATLRATRDAVIAIDPNGHVLWMNGNAERLTGYPDFSGTKLPLNTVFAPHYADTQTAIPFSMDMVLTKGNSIQRTDGHLILTESKKIPITYQAAPVWDGEQIIGALITFHSAATKEKAPRGGGERKPPAVKKKILLMDDDEMLLNLTSQKLHRLGYTTEATRNSTEAIAKYREAWDAGRPFDLVILDLIIRGGPGGKETMRELLGINPRVKAIISSGYTDDPVLSAFWEYGFSGVARKPYVSKELEGIIKQVLRDA